MTYQMMVFDEFYKEFFFSLNDILKEHGYILVLSEPPGVSIHKYEGCTCYPPGENYDLRDRHRLIRRILELINEDRGQ